MTVFVIFYTHLVTTQRLQMCYNKYMNKSEIKQLAKEIASEAIAETQIAFSEMLIKRTEEIQSAMLVSFEYYMDHFREFGVVQMEMKGDMVEMKGDILEIKGDIKIMKEDIHELKTDVAELKIDMKSVKNRLDVLEPRMHMLEIRETENS